jgi:hypothetical protein
VGSLWALGVGLSAPVSVLSVLGVAVYVAGVAWGLLKIDAPSYARVGLALVWPLGPLAFGVTITILLAASLIAYPAFGAAVLLTAAVVCWALF